MTVTVRSTCRACDGTALECLVPMVPTPPGDSYTETPNQLPCVPLDLYRCATCGLVQLVNVIDADTLYSAYRYTTASSLGLTEHFDALAAHLVDLLALPAGARVIDIGSNDGTLVSAFQSRQMITTGVEPCVALAAAACARGCMTAPLPFTAALADVLVADDGQAHLITATNVIANVDDLANLIQGIRTLLRYDGVWVFETGSLWALLTRSLVDVIYHEHLSYFSLRPLQRLLAFHGLSLTRVESLETKGGSLRCYVQWPQAAELPCGDRDWMLACEDKIDLRAWLIDFAQQMQRNRAIFRDQFDRLRLTSEMIGYGASVGVTTLLYHYGLNACELHGLVDDNPARHGLYSPGLNLRVSAPSTLPAEATLVLLAWRYADQIRAKRPRQRWIQPLPALSQRAA